MPPPDPILDPTGASGTSAKEFVQAITQRVALSRAEVDEIMTSLNSTTTPLTPEQLTAFNFRLNEYFSQLNFISTAQKEIFDTIKGILAKL